MNAIVQLKNWVQLIKRDALAVYFAARDTRTPPLPRLLAIATAAYAFSPIDLIPDFIPILGYLDDMLLVPLGLFIVIRLLPPGVLVDARKKASAVNNYPSSYKAGAVIVCIWILSVLVVAIYWSSV